MRFFLTISLLIYNTLPTCTSFVCFYYLFYVCASVPPPLPLWSINHFGIARLVVQKFTGTLCSTRKTKTKKQTNHDAKQYPGRPNVCQSVPILSLSAGWNEHIIRCLSSFSHRSAADLQKKKDLHLHRFPSSEAFRMFALQDYFYADRQRMCAHHGDFKSKMGTVCVFISMCICFSNWKWGF